MEGIEMRRLGTGQVSCIIDHNRGHVCFLFLVRLETFTVRVALELNLKDARRVLKAEGEGLVAGERTTCVKAQKLKHGEGLSHPIVGFWGPRTPVISGE